MRIYYSIQWWQVGMDQVTGERTWAPKLLTITSTLQPITRRNGLYGSARLMGYGT
jgi:hypothetical protein